MVVFTWIDWLWVALYLLLMIGSGFFFYRLGKRSQSDFFLAGRGLPWWLPAASVYATHTATDTPMWVTGVIYRYGLAGIWYTFFSAWCAISAFVSTRIFRRSLAYTQAEWSVLRFGGLGAELIRGWMAGWQVFMNMFILGWVGIAMGKVCNFLFGWAPWVGLVVFSGACAIYVLAAGYWGVVVADFQQGIIAFFVIVLVSIWGIAEAGGPSAIVQKLTKMGEAHRLDPFAFTGWFTGDFPVAWFLTMLFIALLGGFGDGHDDRLVRRSPAHSVGAHRTRRQLQHLVGQRAGAHAQRALGRRYPGVLRDVSGHRKHGRVRAGLVPIGLRLSTGRPDGLFFAAIVAIHLSTISTHLNLGALYATRDIYQHYVKPHASERELVWVGRIATLILLIGSLIYGLMMEEITSWLIFALWIMAAGVWLPNILQVVWWRFNAWGYLSAWIANLGFSWLVVWVLPAFGVLPPLADYEQFWLLMVLGALVYIPVTLLTPPEDMDHLVKYYVMARPIGWWGPVRREAERRGLLTPKGQPAFVDPNQTRPS